MSDKSDLYTKEILEDKPSFDMFALLELMQETRMGGEILDELGQKWDEWLEHLHINTLKIGTIGYLLVWLDKKVEEEIDSTWSNSPEESFRFNCLAQCMIMSCVHMVQPMVEEAGCAPAPRPTDNLIDTLEDIGVPYNANLSSLSLRFATLTHNPFKGACEICHLQQDCPKAQGKSDSFHSVEIPGHK